MTLLLDIASLLPRITEADLAKFCTWYEKYTPHFASIDANLYRRLPVADRARFLTWFLKRWAKIDLVNPVERGLYTSTIQRVKHETRTPETLEGRPYLVRDFVSQGYDFSLLGYDWFLGVHDIQYNQYEHGDNTLRAGDVIVDAGAFIGDTAVFYHHKLAGDCHIHSFELLDENLQLLVHNCERNGLTEEQITLNKLALTDKTGDEIVMGRGASQGSTSIFGREPDGDRVQTIRLDDYVVGANLPRVDYIKMDIEGAEVAALRGAVNTLRHFQPRLAICLYHLWDDMITIPKVLNEVGVDYRYSFKWVQLSDGWEAVLHAVPADAATALSGPAPEPLAASVEAASRSAAAALDVLTKAYGRRTTHLDTLQRAARESARQATPVAVA
jgi:FkbM family methyltransferase